MADDVEEYRGDALPGVALADLTDALALTEDEDAALAAVASHLPRLGLTADEQRTIAAATARVRDTWHEGQAPDAWDLQGRAATLLRVLTTLVAGHLRLLRMTAAHAEMAEERAVLQAVTTRLSEAPTLDAAMRAFRLPAPAPEEASMLLCSVEDGPDGAPKWMTVVAMAPAPGKPATTPVGTRFHLPDLPVSRWLLAEPGTPVMIGSLAQDSRVDEATRQAYARMGVEGVLMMSLMLRGRVAGTLALTWTRPVALGERERRIYRALARQAAVLVDNTALVERLQATLTAAQKQAQLLGTVLDHVPVGIMCLDGGSRRTVMINRAAQAYFGGEAAHADDIRAEILYPGTDESIPEGERPGARAGVTGELVRDEVDIVPPGGKRGNFEVVGVPLLGADGKPERVVVLLSDVTAHKQEAAARTRLQDEVIRVQAAALAERSTPLMPIFDDVLVLPLIGTIDGNRGEQILEVVLNGARERRARVTILDVTGVPAIDTRAAEVLTGAAHALRLLGVEAVISGLRPEVAQALIDLDVPLGGIVACGTLQAAIQHAQRRRRR